jgi:hypothetical protein
MGGTARYVAMVFAVGAVSLVVGCGGDPDSSPLPLVSSRGGPHMEHPQLVPIFFADDADATTLTQFSQWIVQSTWLTAVGADYGVR